MISLVTVLRMDPQAKQEKHNGLGKQTIEKYRCWEYAQPQNQHDLGGERVGKQRKVLFIQRNLFLFNICDLQLIVHEATWHFILTKGKAAVLSGRSSGLWHEVRHLPFVKKINIDCSCTLVVKVFYSPHKRWGCALKYSACAKFRH